ncbi:MAG: hypothetical protein COU35_02905 [Candidatus Magasanikbacteria bacterium CG10_big_fil_rev_8_21_14_0_10_47_10]|uniref:50S ribosomal protein L7/L12 n=1 Tax=Candidatus Magasanikbacteria bacterium CG10_big_fil_rev_8_21_14_0_10_47_10 TaxID=1974652 RepID=A0A2H0TQC1_9BACT|nr:MAG: hypothetical protein COU35_02905 [Candidatus Magasanikbacteria bacterium CG10_big_fil_rev_8_21_14_0_10_47_10]
MNHLSDLLGELDTKAFFVKGAGREVAAEIEPTVVLPEPESPPPQTAAGINVPALRDAILLVQTQLGAILNMLDGDNTALLETDFAVPRHVPSSAGTTLEGVFSGYSMVAQDGNEYPLSPNYASKSKLVEGDLLKLTIDENGRLIYKQIGPIVRRHVGGSLLYDAPNKQWNAVVDGRQYKILTAAITFHRGEIGDALTCVIPDDGESEWAAIEHLIKK